MRTIEDIKHHLEFSIQEMKEYDSENQDTWLEDTLNLLKKYGLTELQWAFLESESYANKDPFPLYDIKIKEFDKECLELFLSLVAKGILVEMTEKQIKRYQTTYDIEYDKSFGITQYKTSKNWTRKIKKIIA